LQRHFQSCDVVYNPLKQLEEAIEAVFKSWDNDRARIYRDLNDIPHDIGTIRARSLSQDLKTASIASSNCFKGS
jgi:phosphoenolpyruvate synthase/pyruvate phosphate dikinase